MVHNLKKLILVICTFLLYGAAYCKQLSGTFKYNNTECKWTEIKTTHGKSDRQLSLKCDKTNPKLFCKYIGNPHSCPAYNKKQSKYYQCLADTLAGKGNLCTIEDVSCAKMCEDIVFRIMPKGLEIDRENEELLKVDLDEAEDGDDGDDIKSKEGPNKEEEVNEEQQNKQNMMIFNPA